MKNLLSAVRKYPIGDNDPFENFITEAWAWVLNNNQSLSSGFLNWFFDLNDSDMDTEWKTQEHYDGYIDLLGISESCVYIFEHKVDAIFQEHRKSSDLPTFSIHLTLAY